METAIQRLQRSDRRSRWLDLWRRFRRHRLAVAGLILVSLMFFTGVFAPWLAPYSYTRQDLDAVEQMPSLAHPLGTDELGRDQLSRIIWGARTAVVVAPSATLVGVVLGLVLGSLAGYVGGLVETLIMRLADILFAFPGLLFALLVAATLQPGIESGLKTIEPLKGFVRAGYAEFLVVIIALSLVGWPGMARLVRGQILVLKEAPFVEAARAIGASPWRILWRHILPNAMAPLVVSMSMSMGGAILAEATLSFLGIGIRPPTASWGAMIYDNYTFWRSPAAPVNFLGDGLNDALTPHLE
jgi:ABC-type dipeptide/oligopeptide/nickel transport system permease subunit